MSEPNPSQPAVAIPSPPREDTRDLGFGSVVAGARHTRLLNRDGSFNVERRGLPWRATLSAYDWLLNLSWPRFLGAVGAFYLLLNTLFAFAYLALGPGALAGAPEVALESAFSRAFFFSVESLSTVGYGHLIPVSTGANLLMTVESFTGILTVALVTGIAFARFSRPQAKIFFSRRAVIAPYRDGKGFMFRIVNQRRSQLIEVEAKVILARFEAEPGGPPVRRFHDLPLARRKVTFFPASWTVVHPIDEASPLAGATRESLEATAAEFLILLSAVDENFSQTVHTRSSYAAENLVWDARFVSVFTGDDGEGRQAIDLGKLDEVEKLEDEPGKREAAVDALLELRRRQRPASDEEIARARRHGRP